MRIFLSLLVLVVVSGCTDYPSMYPTGSYRAQEAYKTTAGPVPNDIGYEYSAEENAKVVQVWEEAIVSLVDQLEGGGFSPQSVYVMPHVKSNAFLLTFDHVLRQELRGRGYILSADVRGVPVVDFDADFVRNAEGKRIGPPEAKDAAYGQRALRVSAWSGGQSVATGSGVHVVPLYGFDDTLPPAKRHSVMPLEAIGVE